MNETVRLLQEVLRNARTGESGVEQLLLRAEEPEMRRELTWARDGYQRVVSNAESALQAAGGRPEPLSAMARAGMWMGMQINTLADKSDDHLAEIFIQGATMGVIEMTRALNAWEDADPDARGLASDFVTWQQEAIERQKAFLASPSHA